MNCKLFTVHYLRSRLQQTGASMENNQYRNVGVGVGLGAALGLVFGMLIFPDNPAVGIGIGVAIGVAIGVSMSRDER